MSGRIVIGRALTQGCLLCPLGPWRMALAARKAGLDKGADAAAAALSANAVGGDAGAPGRVAAQAGEGEVSATAKRVLDPACGSRMFWFDRSNPDVLFADCRTVETTLCDGRRLVVAPDVVADFRAMPWPDEAFRLVVFDPPHLVRAGARGWLRAKYGVLPSPGWQACLRQGMDECMRVLTPGGVLVFKWNEAQVKLRELLDAIRPWRPLFGNRGGAKTHWLVFLKGGKA